MSFEQKALEKEASLNVQAERLVDPKDIVEFKPEKDTQKPPVVYAPGWGKIGELTYNNFLKILGKEEQSPWTTHRSHSNWTGPLKNRCPKPR